MKSVAIFCTLLFLALPALAQNDLPANVNMQFRFVNPGARAQAMGGAFIGLADDTTAIFANPAGLARLPSRTLALETNRTSRDNPIPFYQGRVNQTGLQDFSFELESRDFAESGTSIPFLAYVQPKHRIKYGFFLAEQASFNRVFDTGPVGVDFFNDRILVDSFKFVWSPSTQNFVDLSLRSLGFSFAGQVSDRFFIGATLAYNQLDYAARTTAIVDDPRLIFPEKSLVIPSDFPIGETFYDINVDGDDRQLSVYVGALYSVSDKFSLGVAYKQQPKFDYSYQLTSLGGEPDAGGNSFNVPDSLGLGFSFLPSDTTTLSFEVTRLYYSDLSEDFESFFSNDTDPSAITQTVGDTTEYHLGLEYFITSTTYPIALRAGYWFEPYHALVNTSLDTQLLYRYVNDVGNNVPELRPTFFLHRFEEDLNHFTLGVGVSFGKFTLDFSGDRDDFNSSYSLSSIYRF